MATASEASHTHTMQMTISQVSKLESIRSSKVSIYGIPWWVKVCKNGGEENDQSSLEVYLCCKIKDKTLKQSVAGAVTFKLLPFGDGLDALEQYFGPFTFHTVDYCCGHGNDVIQWDDLFNVDNMYVKDDEIKLEFKFEAENPNDPNKSGIQFECVEKSCDCGCIATYRLKVANISRLMAVCTPVFDLRGLSWYIEVGRNASTDDLFAHLYLNEFGKEFSCKVTMLIKLLSSKHGAYPDKRTETETITTFESMRINDIISWNELIKPENGFVNNDSITLELEIKADKPQDEDGNRAPIAKRARLNPENEAKTPQMDCPICFKCIANQDLAVTPCGHLFCYECIKKAIAGRAACPACNKVVRSNTLRQLYLPGAH